MNKLDEIQKSLEEYNNFEDCIIDDIRFSDYLFNVEIDINYIYEAQKKIRGDIDQKRIVTLVLRQVKKFDLSSDGYFDGRMDFEMVNWSANEIATTEVKELELSMNGKLLRLSLLWETRRSLEIECLNVSILNRLEKT